MHCWHAYAGNKDAKYFCHRDDYRTDLNAAGESQLIENTASNKEDLIGWSKGVVQNLGKDPRPRRN